MQTFVLELLALSFAGTLAALGVWLVSLLLRRLRAPHKLTCLLWLAVGVRFALPWKFYITLPRPKNPATAAVADRIQQGWQGAANTVPAGAPAVVNTPLPAVPAAPGGAFTVWHALALLWAVVAAVLILRAVVSYGLLRRRVALACRTPDGCYEGEGVALPFTLGIFRPRIYMPQSVQGEERAAILLHERTHIRRRDTLTKPLFYLVVLLHWFNPAAWLAYCAFTGEMEAACDEAALKNRPFTERTNYCESIFRYATAPTAPGVLSFSDGGLKTRIARILHYRKPKAWMLAVCTMAVALAGTACMLTPKTEAAPDPATPTSATNENADYKLPETPLTAETAAAPVLDAVYTDDSLAKDDLPTSMTFIQPFESYTYIARFLSDLHNGTDIAMPEGTPVYAAADGVVIESMYHYSYGNYVTIDHGMDAEGRKVTTLYGHLNDLAVEAGQSVKAGDLIGHSGSTGDATGNHLHLELNVDGTRYEATSCIPYDVEK